jgi:release factor glutamine methyltransferase
VCAGEDPDTLATLLARRLTGEPLAWITGASTFCGLEIGIEPGVYVPRPQTEPLARRAAASLPGRGIGIDVCTGSGAIARVMSVHRPDATVIATDIDPTAVACARANGVDARRGDLFQPLPAAVRGNVDVIVGVVPYVPTRELRLLQRDTLTFEAARIYDGGADGADVLRRVIEGSSRVLRRGGTLLLELGGDQSEAVSPELERWGFAEVEVLTDEDGDLRGLAATHR